MGREFEAEILPSPEGFLRSAAPESHVCLILDIHLPGTSVSSYSTISPRPYWPRRRSLSLRRTGQRTAVSVPYSQHRLSEKAIVRTVLLAAIHSLLKRGGSYEEGSFPR